MRKLKHVLGWAVTVFAVSIPFSSLETSSKLNSTPLETVLDLVLTLAVAVLFFELGRWLRDYDRSKHKAAAGAGAHYPPNRP